MTVELEGSEVTVLSVLLGVTVLSVLLGVTVLSVLTVPLAVGVSLLLFAGTVLSLSALSFSRFPLNLNANRVLCFFMMI